MQNDRRATEKRSYPQNINTSPQTFSAHRSLIILHDYIYIYKNIKEWMYLFSTEQSWQCKTNSWKKGNKFPQPLEDAMLKSLEKCLSLYWPLTSGFREIYVSCGEKRERRKWFCVLVLQTMSELCCKMPKRQTWSTLLTPALTPWPSGQTRKTDARDRAEWIPSRQGMALN